jgi:hypothetical protein
MRIETFSANILKTLLLKHKIATMVQLKKALNTSVNMTVLRKLKQLSYQTSYSHSGKYYTLQEIPKYDKNGLWSYRDVCFSIHNTLLNTLRVIVSQSTRGYSKRELEKLLNKHVQESLFQLYKDKSFRREKIGGLYFYFAAETAIYRQQKTNRQNFLASFASPIEEDGMLTHELKAGIILFFSMLDEQQKRLYAGLESLKLGHGGDKKISELLLIDPHTVAKGRESLLIRDIKLERIRKQGGGRHAIQKKRQT